MNAFAAVILAGGRSSRMGGGDKALIEISGRAMIALVIERIGATVKQVAINANGDQARFGKFGLPVLADAVQTFDGPLAGILAAMRWASRLGLDRVLTVAGDTPFFPDSLAERLAATGNPSTISVAASHGRLHPAFALWPTAIAPDLEDQLTRDRRRVTDFIARHPSVEVDFPDRDANGTLFDPFFNVNTPQDLADARRIADMLGI